MKNQGARVSVIIPCFNCAATLARAIRSVQEQTIPIYEIIIVDDASNDHTPTVMKELAKEDDRIRCIYLGRNGGPSRARNRGWGVASGDFIAFLDSDDTWHPDKISLQLRVFQSNPALEIVGHLCDISDDGSSYPDLQLSDAALAAKCRPVDKRWAKLSNPWSTPTVMLRRTVPFRFEEDLRAAEDYLLWASILLDGGQGVRIELPLARLYKARFGAGGLSGNLWRMEKGELAAYRKLYLARQFSALEWAGLSAYSLLKHMRRLALQYFLIGRKFID